MTVFAPTPRRLVTFRVVAVVTALLFVLAIPNILAVWWPISLDPSITDPGLARWHTVVEGTGDAAGVLLLIALIRRPAAHPLVPLSYGVAVGVASLLVLPFTGPTLLFAIVPVLAVLAAYPYWGRTRSLLRSGISWSRPALALVVLAAAALAIPIASAVTRQIAGIGEMATTNQWATYAEHLTTLVLSGVLAATGLPGWRLFGGVHGASWIYLGMASIVLAGAPDSWGVVGGLAALAIGVGWLVVVLRHRQTAPEPEPAPATA